MQSWVCRPGLMLVRFGSRCAALLSQPTPAGCQDAHPWPIQPRGIEAPLEVLQTSLHTQPRATTGPGETWWALVGLPKAIQTGLPYFSEHLKYLWSTGSLLSQA